MPAFGPTHFEDELKAIAAFTPFAFTNGRSGRPRERARLWA